MTKRKILFSVSVLALLGAAIYYHIDNNKMLLKPDSPAIIQAPSPIGDEKLTPTNTAVRQKELQPTSRMEMPESSKRSSLTAQTNNSFSYSIKSENKECVITPGVSYIPGEGLNIKTDKQNETIQIQRDHTYNNDYQVVWKKKY